MLLTETWAYFLQDQARLGRLLTQHLALSFAALGIALALCLPLGVWIAHRLQLATPVINFFSALRLLPSLVILFLALPVIVTGIRIAAVEVIASATLAAFIAGGGLGEYITRGFALTETKIMLVGAVAVALLALAVDALIAGAQQLARRRTGLACCSSKGCAPATWRRSWRAQWR